MKRKGFVYLLLLVSATVAAGPFALVGQSDARTLLLETSSVQQLRFGTYRFTLRGIFASGFRPVGATETVAIVLNDYEIDCWRRRAKETGTRYVTDEDKDAGRAPDIEQKWTDIAPGSDLDVARKKIC
ncbi:hypothetical protein QZM82_32005 [Burkholderia cepacia]|uniref:hypothetical protein n=1 Tax=Burkholderia cepacia TaxID=292 RepID=UPI0026570632|nr:hypothetical protein [Burkholderia cepacia]MDN7900825.1 hypothetical protein [Burkholderia cepacia]